MSFCKVSGLDAWLVSSATEVIETTNLGRARPSVVEGTTTVVVDVPAGQFLPGGRVTLQLDAYKASAFVSGMETGVFNRHRGGYGDRLTLTLIEFWREAQ